MSNVVTYPAAENFARTMALPMTFCSDTYELYGIKKSILDTKAAKSILFKFNNHMSDEAQEAALAILRERVSAIR